LVLTDIAKDADEEKPRERFRRAMEPSRNPCGQLSGSSWIPVLSYIRTIAGKPSQACPDSS
jgi:hypothetical protein